jgi:hypothetical protein
VRSRGGPRQAAGAQPIQEAPKRRPAWAAPEKPPALLIEALNNPVVITIDGVRREITKREAVTQLAEKSAGADSRATRMPFDMLKHAEEKAGVTPPPEPAPFTGRTRR